MMKKRMLLSVTALLLCLLSLTAQNVHESVAAAFDKGDAQELAKHLAEKVGLSFDAVMTNVDKAKAAELLTEFFAENKVNGFQVNHQSRRDESGFLVGTLTTVRGKYRVNNFFKKSGNQYLIHQIRIDKVNE